LQSGMHEGTALRATHAAGGMAPICFRQRLWPAIVACIVRRRAHSSGLCYVLARKQYAATKASVPLLIRSPWPAPAGSQAGSTRAPVPTGKGICRRAAYELEATPVPLARSHHARGMGTYKLAPMLAAHGGAGGRTDRDPPMGAVRLGGSLFSPL
jgi:hypothetical protein